MRILLSLPAPSARRSFFRPSVFLCLVLAALLARPTRAVDPESDVLAGHSAHGEAFNEGPRQAAYIMPGMDKVVSFPASTKNPIAQRFINQGVAQLHGFWYYEAERSFRQAAVLDPDCALAYWGMAMANTGNLERARDFMKEATERLGDASDVEQRFIKAYDKYCQEETPKGKEISKKDRSKQYTLDLEEIVEEYPDNIEAKAFLALQLWLNERAELPIVSHVAVNALLQDVFDASPMHPAHHYRIHLWDRHKAKRALESAAKCGPSLPGIAHMWHMPGHIYDKLHRYHDATWQQEASARVDHAHMMRDRVLPDQIHNFAHNNEWFIRNMLKIGRINEALDLAKNMLELPRHPKYNTINKRGSTKYGRERLLLALTTYQLWEELIELADTMYLEATDQPAFQIERQMHLAMAHALTGNQETSHEIEAALKTQLESNQTELKELKQQSEDEKKKSEADSDSSDVPPEVDSKKAIANRARRKKEREARTKELKDLNKKLESAIATAQACQLAAQEKFAEAVKKWKDTNLKNNLLKSEWQFAAGQVDDAFKTIDKEIDSKPGQLLPLATKAFLQFKNKGAESAKDVFEEARELSATANLETPLLARLAPLAEALDYKADWRAEYQAAEDIGARPALDSLGPFRWHPYLAPEFTVTGASGEELSLKDLGGKPTLVIFYLGFGCLHCVEQLHEFSPRAKQFQDAGIDIVGISSESAESLSDALKNYSKPLEIPLHADRDLMTFKAFRCFDDFEKQPLHGTFLIAPDGRVLWQDISYEPFMDVDFALNESLRLLSLAGFSDLIREPKPTKTFVRLPGN